MAVEVEKPVEGVVRDTAQDVSCDFVDGFAFGDALGFGLRSVDGWWTVKNVSHADHQVNVRVIILNDKYNVPTQFSQGISLRLLRETRIAPTQTRIIPLRIVQSEPFTAKELHINVQVVSGASIAIISVSLPINHHSRWTSSSFTPLKASYFFAESMPTSFVALPPIKHNNDGPRPPILALRWLLHLIFITTI